jgi:hypothetical protein
VKLHCACLGELHIVKDEDGSWYIGSSRYTLGEVMQPGPVRGCFFVILHQKKTI